jgi:hypothetical protein
MDTMNDVRMINQKGVGTLWVMGYEERSMNVIIRGWRSRRPVVLVYRSG